MNAIVITGGTRGLDAALTKHFVAKGRNVVMNYRNPEAAEHMTEACKGAGAGQRTAVRADVRALFDAAAQAYGGANILINCAGINRDASFLDLTDETRDVVVDTHLKGAFICAQKFVHRIADCKGCIINLGAACGIQGRRNGANFCSATDPGELPDPKRRRHARGA